MADLQYNRTMLMIRTNVKPSTVGGAGLGLFADQFIKKGAVTWRFCPGYDQIISRDDLLRMSEESRDQFLNYCYFDKRTKHFILCGDDERFINHSEEPNIVQSTYGDNIEGVEIAARDIKPGEELFVNYYDFDADAERKLKKLDIYTFLEENGSKVEREAEKSFLKKFNIFYHPVKAFVEVYKKPDTDHESIKRYVNLLHRIENN